MNQRSIFASLLRLFSCALLAGLFCVAAAQAQNEKPLTSQELAQLLYQLPAHPERRDAVVEEIRRRGLGFELTNGMRSLAASKSGNDPLLRRTLEEAERRRENPAAARRPDEAEGLALLERARRETREATAAMPDFVVKQLITRAVGLGQTKNWRTLDHLTVAVSYRESQGGEQYKLLAVNGIPAAGRDAQERGSYEQENGATSTGEFVTTLKELFADESQAKFTAVDTDTLRDHRAIVYEYEVKLPNSKQTLIYKAGRGAEPQVARVGYRGRAWIDRETARVLRLEIVSTDIPAGFPITAATNTVDYDWVKIAEREYLLPVRAEVELTSLQDGRVYQAHNEIRFRNYQKYGAEVKIVEEDDFPADERKPPKKP